MPHTRYHERYANGVLVSRTPYVVSDAQAERDAAPERLRAALTRLTAIAQQAEAASQSTGGSTVAQLTAQHRILCGHVADLARDVRALIRHQLADDD